MRGVGFGGLLKRSDVVICEKRWRGKINSLMNKKCAGMKKWTMVVEVFFQFQAFAFSRSGFSVLCYFRKVVMCSGARTLEEELRNENFHFNPCSFSFIYQGVTRNFRDRMMKKHFGCTSARAWALALKYESNHVMVTFSLLFKLHQPMSHENLEILHSFRKRGRTRNERKKASFLITWS